MEMGVFAIATEAPVLALVPAAEGAAEEVGVLLLVGGGVDAVVHLVTAAIFCCLCYIYITDSEFSLAACLEGWKI